MNIHAPTQFISISNFLNLIHSSQIELFFFLKYYVNILNWSFRKYHSSTSNFKRSRITVSYAIHISRGKNRKIKINELHILKWRLKFKTQFWRIQERFWRYEEDGRFWRYEEDGWRYSLSGTQVDACGGVLSLGMSKKTLAVQIYSKQTNLNP